MSKIKTTVCVSENIHGDKQDWPVTEIFSGNPCLQILRDGWNCEKGRRFVKFFDSDEVVTLRLNPMNTRLPHSGLTISLKVEEQEWLIRTLGQSFYVELNLRNRELYYEPQEPAGDYIEVVKEIRGDEVFTLVTSVSQVILQRTQNEMKVSSKENLIIHKAMIDYGNESEPKIFPGVELTADNYITYLT